MSRQLHVRLDHATVKDATPGVRPQIATDFISYPNSDEEIRRARLRCAENSADAEALRELLDECGLL
jgi:hypothetical protein